MYFLQLQEYGRTLFPYMSVTLLVLPMMIVLQTKASELTERVSVVKTNAFYEQKNMPGSSQRPEDMFADGIKQKDFFNSNELHFRRKRLVWITEDGRLALPPGTSLTFTPTIAMPLVRHPPEGFFSNVSISFPLTIDFDKLGLTDESNPLGDLPPIFTRQFGHSTGKVLGDYLARYLHYKAKRDLSTQSKYVEKKSDIWRNTQKTQNQINLELPQLPERFKHAFHGGERVMLYGVVEHLLETFGVNGKACLLRAICEIHSRRIQHLGVLGEMVKLFLTATSSPFANLIPEYVSAQEIGEGRKAPGECFPFYKACPKSIFRSSEKDKYSQSTMGKNNYSPENEAMKLGLHRKLPMFTSPTSTDESHEKPTKFSM